MAALKRSLARENAGRRKACKNQVEIQQSGIRSPPSSIAVARPRRAEAKRRGRSAIYRWREAAQARVISRSMRRRRGRLS
jgi:hypothetical protein